MRIIFPHIPKCAGSTIRQQLENREDVYFDYFNHPTWMSEIDKLEGSIKQNQLKAKLASIENWIVFGHFSSATYEMIFHMTGK